MNNQRLENLLKIAQSRFAASAHGVDLTKPDDLFRLIQHAIASPDGKDCIADTLGSGEWILKLANAAATADDPPALVWREVAQQIRAQHHEDNRAAGLKYNTLLKRRRKRRNAEERINSFIDRHIKNISMEDVWKYGEQLEFAPVEDKKPYDLLLARWNRPDWTPCEIAARINNLYGTTLTAAGVIRRQKYLARALLKQEYRARFPSRNDLVGYARNHDEVQVAQMASEGLSDQEIAARYFDKCPCKKQVELIAEVILAMRVRAYLNNSPETIQISLIRKLAG